MLSLKEEIEQLKKEKNAVILAHYYVPDDVQEVADYIGDSFYLSKIAKNIVDDFLVASEQVVLSKGQLNESICKNGKIGLNKSENKLFITFENGSMIYDTKAGFIDSYVYKNHEMIN